MLTLLVVWAVATGIERLCHIPRCTNERHYFRSGALTCECRWYLTPLWRLLHRRYP